MYPSRKVSFRNKENYQAKRTIRAAARTEERRFSRHKTFERNRNIEADLTGLDAGDTKDNGPVKSNRYQQLLEWKRKKEQQKKAESELKAKTKPPFKCGTVHYKLPPVLEVPSCLRRSDRINKKITNESLGLKVVTSIKPAKEPRIVHFFQPNLTKGITRSFAPRQHQFKAPKNLLKIEEACTSVVGEGAPDGEKQPLSFVFPVQLSPWISHKRGSGSGMQMSPNAQKLFANKESPENLRKLVGKRAIKNMLRTPQQTSREEKMSFSKMNSPALSEEDSEKLKSFRALYDGEMKRLEKNCMDWDSLLSSEDCDQIPQESRDAIRTTIGQTRLLMREKLCQFKNLLDEFEWSKKKSKQPSRVMTHGDLQGFWDLVSIQVNDVDTKFANLGMQKCNNWIAIEAVKSPLRTRLHVRGVDKNVTKSKTTAALKKSTFRTYLADLRKKKKMENEDKTKENILGTPEMRNITPNLRNTTPKIIKTTPKITFTTPKITFMTPNSGKTHVFTPQPANTPARSILKRRSSTRLNFNPETNMQGNPFGNNKHNFMVIERPKASDSGKDLIVWESPLKDEIDVRRSPRLRNKMK